MYTNDDEHITKACVFCGKPIIDDVMCLSCAQQHVVLQTWTPVHDRPRRPAMIWPRTWRTH